MSKRIDLQAAGRGIVIQITGDGASAERALQMVQEQLAKTASSAKEHGSAIEKAMERVTRAIEYVGLYEGIRGAIDGIKELVVGSIELGEQMTKMSQRTGLSVETLSTLHYAAAITGSDFEGLVNGIGRMEKTIGMAADGNKAASALMRSLGLDAKDLAGRTDGAEIAFHKFVSTLAATESPIRRNELAMQLMGKAGSAQIPVLIEIAEHWDEFKQKASDAGVLLTSETAKALADTSHRLADMEQHVKGAGMALTEGLSPGLSQFFAVLENGKTPMAFFTDLGGRLAGVLNLMAAAAYGVASGIALIGAVEAGGSLTSSGTQLLAQATEWDKKARDFREAMVEGAPGGNKPFLSEGPRTPGGKGFDGDGTGGKAKSDNSIATAATALLEEQGRLTAATQKAIDEKALAELKAQHKLGIVSDQQFYDEKLRLQNDMLDAEISALAKKGADLQALYDKQHTDKGLKRDSQGRSAEELRTQRELLQVQEQMAALETKRAQDSSAYTADVGAAGNASKLAGLKIAAELEKQRNDGIAARIALLQYEKQLEAEKVTKQGGSQADVDNVNASEKLGEQQLRLEEINRQIELQLNDNKRATEAWNDAASKNPLLKGKAEVQVNQLNQATAASVKALVDQYYALAVTMGGPALEAAKNLKVEIEKLNTPSQKGEAQFTKTLTEGVTKMADTLVSQSIRGKTSFKQMVKEMEADAAELALKLLEQSFLKGGGGAAGGGASGDGGFLAKFFGALGEHHMSGGTSGAGPQVLGENGPELWTPPTGGGNVLTAALTQKLADTGGGKVPNVTTNVINQTSSPVTAQPSSVSMDSQMRDMVVHVVLQDAAQGGPISQAFG